MRLRSIPIPVVISVSFVAVFCLALIHETLLGQVIICIIISIPCVWCIKDARQQNGNRQCPEVLKAKNAPPT
jgi:hypothetical protein